MGKKILIIGNGFDLAHGLPTSYADFLDFAERFNHIYTYLDTPAAYQDYVDKHINNWNGNECVKQKLKALFESRKVESITTENGERKIVISLDNAIIDSCKKELENNIWFDYLNSLYREGQIRGKNWIDFEMEISQVIQWLEKKYERLEEAYRNLFNQIDNQELTHGKMYLLYETVQFANIDGIVTVEDFINKLYCDLERLTRALGIYLNRFVEDISVEKIDLIEEMQPDYVISFNYTNTYERVYCDGIDIPICYIHGQCDNLEENNMVMGIDIFRNQDYGEISTDMSIFMKFIQRIRKRNSTQYQAWSNQLLQNYEKREIMRSNTTNPNYFSKDYSIIFVFGHSLDVTDRDILGKFLQPEYTALEIYAKGKVNEGKLLSNMIKIIGEEVIVKKANDIPVRLMMHVV